MSNDREVDVGRTTDPGLLRSVVEERSGHPAHEPRTDGQGDPGLLRIGRHGREGASKAVSRETFEAEFEEKALEYRSTEDPENTDDVDPVGELRERPES